MTRRIVDENEDDAYLERIGYEDVDEPKVVWENSRVTWAQLLEAWERSPLNMCSDYRLDETSRRLYHRWLNQQGEK